VKTDGEFYRPHHKLCMCSPCGRAHRQDCLCQPCVTGIPETPATPQEIAKSLAAAHRDMRRRLQRCGLI